jgi:hypothetical protein
LEHIRLYKSILIASSFFLISEMKYRIPVLSIVLTGIAGVFLYLAISSGHPTGSKIKGVNLEAPARPFSSDSYQPIVQTGHTWVSIIPYGYCRAGQTEVFWDHPRQWWGERTRGAVQSISMAQSMGLKVMLKPHIWIVGEGWTGDFQLNTEEEWQEWEKNYEKYILHYAEIADSMNVELYCISTEFRIAAKERPGFWRGLIQKVRKIYKGKLTYAANWDNYGNITFWDNLDYIGIDAYFPLSDSKSPRLEELKKDWIPVKADLLDLSFATGKKILFTEYGYRSAEYSASGHWKLEGKQVGIDENAQKIALEALYSTFCHEPWYAGGFLWKWHVNHSAVGGPDCSRFTPQNKLAEELIISWNKKY